MISQLILNAFCSIIVMRGPSIELFFLKTVDFLVGFKIIYFLVIFGHYRSSPGTHKPQQAQTVPYDLASLTYCLLPQGVQARRDKCTPRPSLHLPEIKI